MKRSLLKILGTTLVLLSTITITLIALALHPKISSSPAKTIPPPPLSRVGVKGELVLIVTQLDSSLGQTDLQVGDIIRATSAGGQFKNIEKFQQAVRATPPNTTIQTTIERFNPSSGKFEERQTALKTFPIPKRPSLSRLSIVGQTGFIIREIDSSMGLTELKIGDIISMTSTSGQISDVEKFQKDVRAMAQFTAFQSTILRFNAATRSFEERQTLLRTIPFPSVPQKQKSTANPLKIGSAFQLEIDCGGEACYWCCERCIGGSTCALHACETGKTHCVNCQFWTCV